MKDQRRLSSDIISTLPPEIIETILCLLPLKEAARTSILSHGWRYKWTKISKLVFEVVGEDPIYIIREEPEYEFGYDDPYLLKESPLHAIYQVLLRHQDPITEFTLTSIADAGSYDELTQIILHLSSSNALKKLHLKFHYKLPASVFSFHKLTDLHLENCLIGHRQAFDVGCRSLTTLHLDSLNISNKALLRLLSNNPLLKSFTLLMHYHRTSAHDYSTLIELFGYLRMIENLTMGHWGIKSFGQRPHMRELPTSLLHLKYFCFKDMYLIEKDDYGLPFLVILIRSSPNLEKIKLQMSTPRRYDELEIDYYAIDYTDIKLEHLIELEIEHFENWKCELDFVKTILAKSPVLEKVNVFLDKNVADDELLKISRLLLSFPSASTRVKIIVERTRPKYFRFHQLSKARFL